MSQVNISFYMLIPKLDITQDQIDNSTSEVTTDMAIMGDDENYTGVDYIVEVEEVAIEDHDITEDEQNLIQKLIKISMDLDLNQIGLK